MNVDNCEMRFESLKPISNMLEEIERTNWKIYLKKISIPFSHSKAQNCSSPKINVLLISIFVDYNADYQLHIDNLVFQKRCYIYGKTGKI